MESYDRSKTGGGLSRFSLSDHLNYRVRQGFDVMA